MKIRTFSAVILAGCLLPAMRAVPSSEGMAEGALTLKSAGPITFGNDGVLFVADSKSAAIVAIDTQDTKQASRAGSLKVQGINEKLAGLLGTSADQVLINDLAVNPVSRNVYLAVSRGRGPDAQPVLARVSTDGQIEILKTDKVRHSRAELPDAPVDGVVGQGNRQSNPRLESITDLAFFEDRLMVAGLSNEEFASTLRAIPFPFTKVANGTSVEIYHGAHGRFETRAPVRTFVPIKVGNEQHLLAAYTCTPLVQFSLKDLEPGAKVKGKTIAELGNRNRPIDMIVYRKDGKDYLLLANSSRGIMKMNAEEVQKISPIEAPVREGTAGLSYETIENWKNVEQLDRFGEEQAIVLRRSEPQGGVVTLESLPLP